MLSNRLPNSLLNRLIRFYQIIGFRVTSFTCTCSWQCTFPLFWSLMLSFPPIYSFFFTSPFIYGKTAFSKPLLNWLSDFNDTNYVYFGGTLLLYYQIQGPTIARHLTCLPLKSKSSEKATFIWFLLLSHVYFAFGYTSLIWETFNQTQPLLAFINLIALYINFHYFLLTYLLLHYGYYTVLVSLAELVQKSQRLPAVEIVGQMQIISKWTKQLNSLLTFPLILCLLNNSIDTLVNIAFFGAVIKMDIIVYLFSLGCYFFYVVHFPWKIASLLGKLTQLGVTEETVQLQGLTVYSNRLTFKLYSLCAVDTSLYYTLLFFILNYSVLLLQTK